MFSLLEQAQYDVVHDFPGGAVKLAPLVGMSAGTLSNKVNPAMETHKLAVAEAVALQHATRDYRILFAEASALDHACLPLGDYSRSSDVAILEAYTLLHAELGEMSAAIHKAFSDSVVSRSEFGTISGEMNHAIRAMLELRTRLEALVDD